LILSSQQLGYTFVKFIGGTLADILDPGLTFVTCLLLTGITCAAFTAAASVSLFAVIWFLCGMAQGPAWSACAVLLKQNFPPDQFATWWSILSTSSNVAGTAGPFVSQAIVSAFSWRASLLTAGSSFISSQEVGGIMGSILTGYISDYLVSKGEKTTRSRLKIIVLLSVLETLGLYLLIFHTTHQSFQIFMNFFGFLVGFGMYGIISLLGVASMELAPENLSGTAHSLATLGGNIGRVMAGYPLSVIATWRTWHESFLVVLLVSVACIVVSIVCLQMLQSRDVAKRKSEHSA
ncbi:unnamed protein product, partial [Candidula unifasciata]